MSVAHAATRHSPVHRGAMLDWLKSCIDEEKPLPTDLEIVGKFGFVEPEQARTLLADLSDRGLIHITYPGGVRHIAIGRQGKATPTGSPRPVPSVTKRDAAVERTVEKIVAIASRGSKGKVSPGKPTPKKGAVPDRNSPPDRMAPEPPRCDTSPIPYRDWKQLNIRISPEEIAKLHLLAQPGELMGQTARRVLMETIGARPEATVELPQKPVVRAAVLRAANTAGADLHTFVAHLIDLGLAQFLAGTEPQRG